MLALVFKKQFTSWLSISHCSLFMLSILLSSSRTIAFFIFKMFWSKESSRKIENSFETSNAHSIKVICVYSRFWMSTSHDFFVLSAEFNDTTDISLFCLSKPWSYYFWTPISYAVKVFLWCFLVEGLVASFSINQHLHTPGEAEKASYDIFSVIRFLFLFCFWGRIKTCHVWNISRPWGLYPHLHSHFQQVLTAFILRSRSRLRRW